MSTDVTAPLPHKTVTSALHTIANNIPSMVAPDARVTVSLWVDDETIDAIAAEQDRQVRTGGGNETCPHTYRTTDFQIDGIEVVVYTHGDGPIVDVVVSSS